MASTADISIRSTVAGLPEGGTDNFSIALQNTSAVGLVTQVTATTGGSSLATTFSVPTSAKYILIVPPSTNTLPVFISSDTSTGGYIKLSSVGASLLSIIGGSTYYFGTTATTAVPIRVSVF